MAIQAVPDDTVDALDTGGREGFGKLVSYRSRHIRFLQGLREDGDGGPRARRPVKIRMRRLKSEHLPVIWANALPVGGSPSPDQVKIW
jgi:hypothetical protein